MGEVINFALARQEREALPVEDAAADVMATALVRRRTDGGHGGGLPPIRVSPDAPVGSVARTYWKRASRSWAAAMAGVENPLRFARSDETAETHALRRAGAVSRMEIAAAELFKVPSPTREDFQNKIRLLAAAIGCREPGTIPPRDFSNRSRRYGETPANEASLVERMLTGLYEREVPAPYELRRGVQREGGQD